MERNACAQNGPGEKMFGAGRGVRDERHSYKFNPLVCGFFALREGSGEKEEEGYPVEFVGGLATGFADGTFARSYIVSRNSLHRLPKIYVNSSLYSLSLCTLTFHALH